MKSKSILLLAVPVLIIVAAIVRWYAWSNPTIHCSGQVTWEIGRETFSGNLSYQLKDGEGLAILSGVLKSANRSWSLGRSIYFSYTHRHNAYLLSSGKIVPSLADNLDARYSGITVPGFYLHPGKELNLIIELYDKRWIFYTPDVPSLLCTKEP